MGRRRKHQKIQEGIHPVGINQSAQHGDGIVDTIKNVWAAVFKGPRTRGGPEVRNNLSKYGNNYIIQINVYREPLSAVIKGVVDAVANKPFDKLFHLYMVVALDNNMIFRIEKNEVVSFKSFNLNQVKQDAEFISCPINKEITINELFQNGINYMGNDKFWLYSATNNNCQDFITGLLKGSGLGNQDVFEFIKQDTKDIVSDFWGNASDLMTDLAARWDIVKNGEGAQQTNRIYCKF